jgi:hypothetical protein
MPEEAGARLEADESPSQRGELEVTSDKVPGYPLLATFQHKFPEYTIFRKFSKINMLNLLYLQAELKHLELEVETMMQDDYTSGTAPRNSYHSNWKKLRDSLADENAQATIENHQYRTFQRLRKVLKRYNEAILQNSQLGLISVPSSDHRKEFQQIITRPEYCNQVVAPDAGAETDTWTDLKDGDFITLYPQPIDVFTRRVLHKLIHFYHLMIGKKIKPMDLETGLWVYPDSTIAEAGDAIAIILSALIPVSAIVSLYYTPSMVGRIFVSFGFAVLLAVALWMLSSVKRNEIFALSTALLAIEVVFIGSTNPP